MPLQSLDLQRHFDLLSRGEKTRTSDPYVPNVVRYQLRYTPIKPHARQAAEKELFTLRQFNDKERPEQ